MPPSLGAGHFLSVFWGTVRGDVSGIARPDNRPLTGSILLLFASSLDFSSLKAANTHTNTKLSTPKTRDLAKTKTLMKTFDFLSVFNRHVLD
jgi:hypothetical protein